MLKLLFLVSCAILNVNCAFEGGRTSSIAVDSASSSESGSDVYLGYFNDDPDIVYVTTGSDITFDFLTSNVQNIQGVAGGSVDVFSQSGSQIDVSKLKFLAVSAEEFERKWKSAPTVRRGSNTAVVDFVALCSSVPGFDNLPNIPVYGSSEGSILSSTFFKAFLGGILIRCGMRS